MCLQRESSTRSISAYFFYTKKVDEKKNREELQRESSTRSISAYFFYTKQVDEKKKREEPGPSV
jgi:hypothetical protein